VSKPSPLLPHFSSVGAPGIGLARRGATINEDLHLANVGALRPATIFDAALAQAGVKAHIFDLSGAADARRDETDLGGLLIDEVEK
jgi:hypothetical protein